jgi:hypothetical protein
MSTNIDEISHALNEAKRGGEGSKPTAEASGPGWGVLCFGSRN